MYYTLVNRAIPDSEYRFSSPAALNAVARIFFKKKMGDERTNERFIAIIRESMTIFPSYSNWSSVL